MGTDKYSLKSCLVKGWNAFKSNPTEGLRVTP